MKLFHANGAPKFGRVLLSAGGDSGGGGGGDGDGKGGDGDGKNGDGKGGDGDDADKDKGGVTISLSQKELDRRIAAARRQAEADATNRTKDAVEKAKLYDDLLEKQKDEGQKAVDAAVAAERDRLTAAHEAEKATLTANTNARLLEADVRQQAATALFDDLDYVWFLAQPELEEGGAITIEEDGTFKGVKEWLTKLAKDKPNLIKAQGDGNHLPNPPRGGGGDGDAKTQMQRSARELVFGGSRRAGR